MLNFLRKSKGVLGMNARNLEYIRPHNKKEAFRVADNKILTKKILAKNDIPIPEIYGVVRGRKGIKDFDWDVLPESFVLKPNLGYGGEGILVIFGRRKDGHWVGSRETYSFFDLISHTYNILDGNFSLFNAPDIAFFEERIRINKSFKPYAIKGIPDIRLIVYNRVPVMAMLRLPTKASGGKANLHQGGVGVGIDIATGVTTTAVVWDRLIENHPDNKLKLRGIRIPYWDDILLMAVKTQIATGIGYVGVDIAIDRDRGPMILEVNVRPGLAIQIANIAPLKSRLKRVEGLKVNSPEKGARVAKELFGGEIEEEVTAMTGRQVIGMIEDVEIHKDEENSMKLRAKVDTGADLSSISLELAAELGFNEALNKFEQYKKTLQEQFPEEEKLIAEIKDNKGRYTQAVAQLDPHLADIKIIKQASGISLRPLFKVNFTLAGVKVLGRATVADRSHLTYPMLIGQRDLKKFLLDPAK